MLNPHNYISSPQELQKHQCTFCFEFDLNMRRCAGPCQKNICTYCLKTSDHQMCRFCCTKLKLQAVKLTPVQFNCPSDHPECKEVIMSEQAFSIHASQCIYIPDQTRLRFEQKMNYRCRYGSLLAIIPNEKHRCSECGFDSKFSVCSKCTKNFCLSCRKPPFQRDICPKGHHFTRQSLGPRGGLCNLCLIHIPQSLYINLTYQDRICHLKICQVCYDKLPCQPSSVKFQKSLAEQGKNDNKQQ